MVRALLAALLLSTIAAPPASASAESRFEGDCGFEDRDDPTRPGVVLSTIYPVFVLYGTDNPVSAVVTCWVEWGEVLRSATFSGTGVVVGVDHGEYVGDAYFGLYCRSVDYTSDDTPTDTQCYYIDVAQIPPQEVVDLLDDVTTSS